MSRYSIEAVRHSLRQNPDMRESTKKYFTAIVNGTLPNYYNEIIKEKRTRYLEETPTIDGGLLIAAEDKLREYMRQTSYITELCATLKRLMDDRVYFADTGVHRSVQQFLKSNLAIQPGDPLIEQKVMEINNPSYLLNTTNDFGYTLG